MDWIEEFLLRRGVVTDLFGDNAGFLQSVRVYGVGSC